MGASKTVQSPGECTPTKGPPGIARCGVVGGPALWNPVWPWEEKVGGELRKGRNAGNDPLKKNHLLNFHS